MSEWSNTKVEDLVTYKKGYAFKSAFYDECGDHLIVRVSDTTENSINIESCHKIRKEHVQGLDSYILKYQDVVVATVGSWADNPQSIVGKVIKVPRVADGAYLNQNAVRLRANERVTQDYLYFALKHKEFSDYLLNSAQGSANQASITLKDIFSYEVSLPPLPEQKAIASVLSSLDDKIDLLHRQNKTLEAMAETLFRQWFIEEAKEDWEEKPLDEVVSHFIDYRGKTPNKTTSGIPLITAKIVKAGRIQEPTEFISEEDYPIWMTRGYPEINDVVLTTEAPLGEVGLIRDTNVALAQRIITMRCNPNIFDNVLLKYYLMSEVGQYELDSRASGTTVFGIKASVLKKLSLPIPPLEQQKAVVEQLHTIEDKMYANEQQARSLAKLRDTLLPKLMSGEVRVQHQTEEVA